ncbi:MAG: hypothetical protein ACM34K_17185 [Bacillota bacterium]
MNYSGQPLLKEALPELASELYDLLMKKNAKILAQQIDSLRIVELCNCGGEFCSTFYTLPKPNDRWDGELYSVELERKNGIIVLDVVDNKIAQVEILFRNDIKRKLEELSNLPE